MRGKVLAAQSSEQRFLRFSLGAAHIFCTDFRVPRSSEPRFFRIFCTDFRVPRSSEPRYFRIFVPTSKYRFGVTQSPHLHRTPGLRVWVPLRANMPGTSHA